MIRQRSWHIGKGAARHLQQIRTFFNKYERAAGSRSRRKRTHGFGLGLNFVRQVIEAHKGKIFVNSIEGELTEFIIYLPFMAKGP